MKIPHLIALLVGSVTLLIAASIQSFNVKAPELFGGARLYYIQITDRLVGFSDGWGWWLFHARIDGKVMDCRLVKMTSGGPTDAHTVPCFGRFTSESKFVGWIDFRGHLRPFCGSVGVLPTQCRSYE